MPKTDRRTAVRGEKCRTDATKFRTIGELHDWKHLTSREGDNCSRP